MTVLKRIRNRIAYVRLAEGFLRDFVDNEAQQADPSQWCQVCENYVRRHEGHKGWCEIERARELLGLPTPELELEVLRRLDERIANEGAA